MFKIVPSILRLSCGALQTNINKAQKQFIKRVRYSPISKYSTEVVPDQDNVLTEEQLESITKGDSELLQKLNVLMLEVQVLRQDGDKVPDYTAVKEQQWEHLLTLPSRSARKRYLKFLWQIEKKNENEKVRKELAKKAREDFIKSRSEEENAMNLDSYRLFANTIFLRLYDTTVNQFQNNKLIQAMRFGQPLVLDCSYSEHMNNRECMNAAKQLMLLFAANRAHDAPFDLHYCNSDLNGTLMKQLGRYIATLHEPWFPLNIHEDSYLNHFPKERLVYLTPHCRNDLEEFNHDDVYIIGAMVDKTNNEPLSLGKAKKEGLRMARFPLDKYLAWSKSTKSLTLNQVCSVLLDMKSSGDWDKSLVHVPRRKIMTDEELSQYGGKFRHERKSFFNDKSTFQNRSMDFKRNMFRKDFQNINNYENFTNDLQPIQRNNYQKFNKDNQTGFHNKHEGYKFNNKNKFRRPNLKHLLEEE